MQEMQTGKRGGGRKRAMTREKFGSEARSRSGTSYNSRDGASHRQGRGTGRKRTRESMIDTDKRTDR